MDERMRSVSPRMSPMPRSPPPVPSIPSITLDDIIASNRRTAASAIRTHHANNHDNIISPRRGKTPYLPRRTLVSPHPRTLVSPHPASGPVRAHRHYGNNRRHHPYSKPKGPKRHFSKAGKLLECSVHYNANGDSKGSAVIEFADECGAINAMANLQAAVLYGMPVVLHELVQ